MNWFSSIILILLLVIGAWWLLKGQPDSAVLVGGERDEHGCLVAAGYNFNEYIGACARQFEMTPDIEAAARMAVASVGQEYALTVVSFNSYEEPGAYDIVLERGEQRERKTVYIRDGQVGLPPNHEEAEMTAFQFMQDIVAIAPPNINPEASARIYQTLTSAARAEVNEATLARDMAAFAKIQDVPDQGVSVEDLQIVSEQGAYLVVGLNYSGGRALRNIHLVIEDGAWKVARISIPNQAGEFEAEGNLVSNNPGMEPDVWYLVHEQPGASALAVKLQFTPASTCARGVENDTCNPDIFEQGQRAYVYGEQTAEGVVQVMRLEFR